MKSVTFMIKKADTNLVFAESEITTKTTGAGTAAITASKVARSNYKAGMVFYTIIVEADSASITGFIDVQDPTYPYRPAI